MMLLYRTRCIDIIVVVDNVLRGKAAQL